MRQKNLAFSTIVKVYIEDIIQVASIPDRPIVTRLQSSAGEFPKSISYSLPSMDVDGIDAFGLSANVQKHEAEENGDYMESTPFITF